jgi:photosystem II stability/assembly factor-like uncharacterized protein
MKKLIIYYILILLFTSHFLYSQEWFVVKQGLSGGYGNDIFFTNVNTGYCIGYRRIIKTTDAGLSWFNLTVDTNINYTSIYFTSSSTGYMAGSLPPSYGKILKTTNAGNNWNEIFSAQVNFGLISIYFPSDLIGYVVGGEGKIFKTTNLGSNWTLQSSNTSVPLNSVKFKDTNTGWIASDISILYTSNGGINWSSQYSSSSQLHSIYFTDLSNGYAVGDNGKMLKTTNGGINWLNILAVTTKQLRATYFINQNVGYAIGEDGYILKTTSAGNNWALLYSLDNYYLQGIYFVNNSTGYICGGGQGDSYVILKTTTGGLSFIKNDNDIPQYYSLSQNYPNPFNPSTNIRYTIPKNTFVKLVVLDILGRKVETLINEKMNPGVYEVNWNASNYPSGVYFYRLDTEIFSDTKKLILLK